MNEHGFDCREIDASLPSFAAGELEPAAREAVGRHVSACPGCRTRADAALRARSALIEGGHARARHAPDLWPSVRQAMIERNLLRQPSERSAPVPAVRIARVHPLAWAAAAAGILAFGTWLVRGLEAPDAVRRGNELVLVPEHHTLPAGHELRRTTGREAAVETAGARESTPDPRAAPGVLVAEQNVASSPAPLPAGTRLRRLGPDEVPLHAQAEIEVFVPEWQGPGRWLRAQESGEQPASWIEAGPAVR